jgi:hypothetical protein
LNGVVAQSLFASCKHLLLLLLLLLLLQFCMLWWRHQRWWLCAITWIVRCRTSRLSS